MTMTKRDLEYALAGLDDSSATMRVLRAEAPWLFDSLWWRKELARGLNHIPSLDDLAGG